MGKHQLRGRGLRAIEVCICSLALVCVPTLAQPEGSASGDIVVEDGISLHYRVEGHGTESVVVLHGGPGLSMAYLLPDLKPLAQKHSLIYYDQRGGGRSTVTEDPARVNLKKHVEDLEAVRRFFGLERFALLGHSWGAGLAAQYAMRYPQRVTRMLLVDPMMPRQRPYEAQFNRAVVARMDAPTRQRLDRLAEAIAQDPDTVAACREFFGLLTPGYLADPASAGRSQGDICADPPAALRRQDRVMGVTMQSLGRWDWRDALRRVRITTLVMHGSADPIPMASAREWAAALPRARLLVVPDSGHFPFFEQPDFFFPAADRFLAGDWPEGAVEVGRK